jgi:hypothetical protein
MVGACLLVQQVPWYPVGAGTGASLMQLVVLLGVGGGTYFGACAALRLPVMKQILPKRQGGQQSV